MPFFLPRKLIALEYIGADESEIDEESEAYRYDIDLAFFITHFGLSKADFDELTRREIAFVYKAYENKLVSDTQNIANAVLNAISNSRRKRGRRALPLWKKKAAHTDAEEIRAQLTEVKVRDRNRDKSWVDKIYKANGKERMLKKLRKRKE